MSDGRPRWAIFSWSVISAVDNADAFLLRAMGAELARRGMAATFFEERANPAVRALMRRSGARALADFRERHPEIEYRTLDPRVGADLVESLTRLLATVDVTVVQRDTPVTLASTIGKLTRHHLQTYLLDTGLGVPFSDMTVEAIEPGNYSGVMTSTEELAARYRRFLPSARVHVFGPLPGRAAIAEQVAAGELAGIASRLIDQLIAIAARDRERARAGLARWTGS